MNERADNPLVLKTLAPHPILGASMPWPGADLERLDASQRKSVEPHEQRLQRARAVHDGVRQKREELWSNAELSPLGRATRFRSYVAEAMESLSKEAKATAISQAVHDEKARKLTAAPALERDDLAGALRDMEIRGYVRGLKAEQRSLLLMSQDVALEIVTAVLRAPAALSGIAPDTFNLLAQRARLSQHGEEIARLEVESIALDALRKAIEVVRDDVNRAVAAAEREAPAETPVA